MKPLIKHTQVHQKIESKEMAPRTSVALFPLSKSRTIDRLKKTLAFPNRFFYDLNRLSIATFSDEWGSKVTLQLIEVDPNE